MTGLQFSASYEIFPSYFKIALFYKFVSFVSMFLRFISIISSIDFTLSSILILIPSSVFSIWYFPCSTLEIVHLLLISFSISFKNFRASFILRSSKIILTSLSLDLKKYFVTIYYFDILVFENLL